MFHGDHLPFLGLYLDPGAGYTFTSSAPYILGFLLSLLAPIGFFFRRYILNKKTLILVLFLASIVAIIVAANMLSNKSATNKRVIIIGFDGMDPAILQQGWDKGLFPNLKKLKDSGYFSPLQSVVPPQSPVAWASFITGTDPSKHQIYDFIMRNPKNYSLNLVFSEGEGAGVQARQFKFSSPPFWEEATKDKIPSTILFMPDTFEPPSSIDGKLLSGMGVPDILGTEGTFTLFTTQNYNVSDFEWRGKVIKVSGSEEIKTNIEGPKYVFLKDTKTATLPLEIKIDKKGKKSTLRLEGKSITLAEKEFSDWLPLDFKLDFFTKVSGIGKFYLKSTSPFELYLSPINFNPLDPVKPISTPKDLSKQVTQANGLYPTLGLPHDTWALEENVFDDAAFLKQADSIITERQKIFFDQLSKFKNGIFFGYFGFTDTISHMFWRYLNTNSPFQDTIFNYYQKADDIVGQTLKSVDKNTSLIILSDHGFYSFDWEFNVNSWLRDHGYLVLKDGKTTGGPLFSDVDWSQTRAYAAGYNSLYINEKGREADGVVDSSDKVALEAEISEKLMLEKDPNGKNVFKKIYTRGDLGIADPDLQAGDLFLGYFKGIRSSWDSAVGTVPKDVINPRTSKWSGDHLFDPTEVPGVLLANKDLKMTDPKIGQVMKTALDLLGVKTSFGQ